MKPNIRYLFVVPALIAVLNLLPAGRVTAQTFATLHSFTASSTNSSGVYTNSDGVNPYAGLITNSSGNTLFGTANRGGSSGAGTVFAVNTDGTGFTNLHSFTQTFSSYTNAFGEVINTNSGGAEPYAGLVLSGNTLYGTAYRGGSSGVGTVFKVNTDGTGFTTLHNFAGYPGDGANPYAGLILSGNTLYGTAYRGGSWGAGTVFAVNTDGTGFTNLHSLRVGSYDPATGTVTNSDGAGPHAGLILSGNTLYGTAYDGGSWSLGTVFAVNTDGTGFTNLHSFNGYSEGIRPDAGLILSGNILYGTTRYGGSGGNDNGNGTVFAVNTDGTGFTNLHSFTAASFALHTNSDGAYPQAGLILSGNTLYGTAAIGGTSNPGTVFAVNTNGVGFTNLHSFTAGDGGFPLAGLILSGNTMYGTGSGGNSVGGSVFSLSFRPQLTIAPSGSNVILTWPTNVAGFDYTGYTLQSAPALTGPFTNLPAATNPYTQTITGPQQFFRLSQ
jgi:uncharacterized repeat protein (TIGR03803 family)